MSKILFVDDDPRALDALKVMVALIPERWDAHFVTSGDAALALLDDDAAEDEPFDAIVSDLDMPQMDGLTLLGAARDAHAEVVRLILSDPTERTSSLQAAGVAHQYLSKPCDAGSLREAVGRSIALRLELADEKLIKAVTATRSLPSVPALYHRLSREINTEDPSLERIAEIVAGDPAMTAKILQIVNSAFVGLRRRISDARHAVTLLGIDMIMALVLVVEVFSQADERGPQAAAVARLESA